MIFAFRILSIFLSFIFGLLVGSFLNVCIHRWPRDESVVRPRSRCPHCGKQIAFFDNIPVLSYLLLRGRCRACQGPISVRYPIVELLNGVLFAFLFARFGLEPMSLKLALFVSMMLVLIFTDLSEFILPDEITLGGLVIGIAMSPFILLEPMLSSVLWFFMGWQPPAWAGSLTESLLGAAVLGGLLYGVGEVYYRVRNVEGLGLGDVKMMAMVGAFWGIGYALLILIWGAIIGAVTGVLIVLIGRKQWSYALPFGSYLGATAIIVVLWRSGILT